MRSDSAPSNRVLRQVPGLRRGSRVRLTLLILWTAFNAAGVSVGIGYRSAGIAGFYLITYLIGLAVAWVIAVVWERGAPRRGVRTAARGERRHAAKVARQQAAAIRSEQEKERLQAKQMADTRRETERRLAEEAQKAEADRQAQAQAAREAAERTQKQAERELEIRRLEVEAALVRERAEAAHAERLRATAAEPPATVNPPQPAQSAWRVPLLRLQHPRYGRPRVRHLHTLRRRSLPRLLCTRRHARTRSAGCRAAPS